MILSCSSCSKKFVVPDSAISNAGRMVQCGSCGNKWRQFPINNNEKTQSVAKAKKTVSKLSPVQQKVRKPKKIKKSNLKKTREISLYSPEYLAKKHGISLADTQLEKKISRNDMGKVSFGFYNSLLIFLVIIIAFSRGLYFSQELIVQKFPFTEYYLDYFFETIRNMFEIWKNLIISY